MQRALVQLEQEGLARADRTAGRQVTQNGEVLKAVRLREALLPQLYYSLNTIIHFRCIVKGLKTFFAEHPRNQNTN